MIPLGKQAAAINVITTFSVQGRKEHSGKNITEISELKRKCEICLFFLWILLLLLFPGTLTLMLPAGLEGVNWTLEIFAVITFRVRCNFDANEPTHALQF